MIVTTVSDIRRTCGITKDLIDDDDVSEMINIAVNEAGRILNSSILPKTTIEAFNPDDIGNPDSATLKFSPILQIKSVKINGTSVSPQYVRVYEDSGIIELTSSAEKTTFDLSKPQNNIVKYVYGMIETGDEETQIKTAITSPTDDYEITVTTGEGSKFKANDWVRIEGMDGYFEVTKVTASTANTITCDLVYPHEATSRIILMQVRPDVKRFVEIITGLMLVAREVGASFKDMTGYSIGDRSVQKGEPYTQWRETHLQLTKEYQRLLTLLRMPSVY